MGARVPLLIGCLLVLTTWAGGQAQVDTGDLSGTVTDQTGAVLPGARVTLVASETGLERNGVTDEEGRYRVPLLSPGRH